MTGDGVPRRLVPPGNAPANRITNATIQLPVGSAGFVAVGDAATVCSPATAATGTQLYPGASESFSVNDLSDVWVASDENSRVLWHAKSV